jgi:hypothetical protein
VSILLGVDMQIRLHQLPAEPLLRAVTTAGIDAGAITFEGQLAWLRTIVERCALTGLGIPPLRGWTIVDLHSRVRRRSAMATSTRLNILAEKNQPTGVIDWANAVIAEPAMDVGSAIGQHLRPSAPPAMGIARCGTLGYQRGSATVQARLSEAPTARDQAVIYYEVFRAVTQLVSVGQARAAGRVAGRAFHSAAGLAT